MFEHQILAYLNNFLKNHVTVKTGVIIAEYIYKKPNKKKKVILNRKTQKIVLCFYCIFD